MKDVNFKSTTIEKGLDLAKDFLQSFIGPSISELGQLFADNVKVWRVNNQLRNLNKVQKIIKNNNIETKQINLKVLFPYLDAVSFEEDENLQDMWANLFVNYIDSKKNLNVIVYPDILKQLSTNEVKILKYIKDKTGNNKMGIDITSDRSDISAQSDEIANLIRLGLIEEQIVVSKARNLSFPITIGLYSLQKFGKEFLYACSRNTIEESNQ